MTIFQYDLTEKSNQHMINTFINIEFEGCLEAH